MEDRKWKHRHPHHSTLATRSQSLADILVRGTNWLGDAVMTTPALLRLREKFPDAHITLLTPEKLRDLWLHHPGGQRNDFVRAGRKRVLGRQHITGGQIRPRTGIPKLTPFGAGSLAGGNSPTHRLRAPVAQLVS